MKGKRTPERSPSSKFATALHSIVPYRINTTQCGGWLLY